MKKITVVLITFILPFSLFALNITGTITDTEGAPLPDVTVILEETGFICYTEADGSFLVPDLPEGDYSLITESDLCRGKRFFLTLDADRDFQIQLEDAVYDMGTIEVTASRDRLYDDEEAAEYSKEELDKTPIYSNPFNAAGREGDVIDMSDLGNFSDYKQYCTTDYGGLSYSSQPSFIIQGAEPDWNSFWLGSTRLLYSLYYDSEYQTRMVFPLDIVESVYLYQGVSPAEYAPGIGGTFAATAKTGRVESSFIKISPSTHFIDLYSEFKLNEESGLLASVRQSVSHLTRNDKGIQEEDTHYYPPITGQMVDEYIPELIGDIYLRYIFNRENHRLTADICGFYDYFNSIEGGYSQLNDAGEVFAITEGAGIASKYRRTNIGGWTSIEWFFEQNNLMNRLSASLSYLTIGEHEDRWDAIKDGFTPFLYSDISGLLGSLSDKIQISVSDYLDFSAGISFDYASFFGFYESRQVFQYESTFLFDDEGNPVFDFNSDLYEGPVPYDHLLDENGYPVFVLGDIIPLGEDYDWSGTFNVLYPSLYAELFWNTDNLSLSGGGGLHWYISDEGLGFYGSAQASIDWMPAEWFKTGALIGISPGRYGEISLASRRLGELYNGIEPGTSLVSPPFAFSAQPYVRLYFSDETSLKIAPWYNWYRNLSGFSMQTNYTENYDFTSPVIYPDTNQGMSFGATAEFELDLADFLFNRASYTLSWTLYDTAEYGWIFANTDFRHIVKDTFYFTPMDGLSIGATLSVYTGMAFTPLTAVSLNPLTTEPGIPNSARDYVPKWDLNLQARYDFELYGLECSAFINSVDLLKWTSQRIMGLKEPAAVGDSTADYSHRRYEDAGPPTELLGFVEIGISAKYSF